MSKSSSGLFRGTVGSGAPHLEERLPYPIDKPTAEVWDHIEATQDTYRGTVIPKSFVVDVPRSIVTPEGKMWTHGNATEHMYEAMVSIKENPRLKGSNPNLYSQFVLYDYYKSLNRAIRKGISFKKTMKVGNWEFAFAPARNDQKFPVVKHALFVGLKK